MARKDNSELGLVQALSVAEVDQEDVSTQFSANITLTPEQEAALGQILSWSSSRSADLVFTMAGFAGSGKSLLLGVVASELVGHQRVAFCAPTGRAAAVLSRSLHAHGVDPLYCGTIHRLMYRPKVDEKTGRIIGWEKRRNLHEDFDLVVMDEASMASAELVGDMANSGVPILAVGDHGQLPPVGEDLNLMQHPNIRLEKVHRQALENPIISFAQIVRSGGDWRKAAKESTDHRLRWVDPFDLSELIMDSFAGSQSRPTTEDPLVLCGKNATRCRLNKVARTGMGVQGILAEGERVSVMKNAYLNNCLIANGFRGRVDKLGIAAAASHVRANISFADERLELVEGILCAAQFGRDKVFSTFKDHPTANSWEEMGLLMDYGYAVTTHRAQGSQAKKVVFLVEDFASSADEARRFVYTGVTRASDELVISF